jgi:multiple sugar transport system substrate-binding protein
MKKIISVILTALLILGIGTAAVAEEPVTLELWLAGNETNVYDAYTAAAEAYMGDHPNVKINITMIAWSEYFTKLSASFVGGMGPDVYAIGFLQYYSLLGNQNMLALNDYIPQDWDGLTDIPENILNLGKADGNYYAFLVPEGRALYYRKDIAEQNGVTEADLNITDMDSFVNLCHKMTVKDGDETVVSGFDLSTLAGNNPEQQLFVLARMLGAESLWADDLAPCFNEAPYVETMKKMKALIDDGTILLQTAGINYFNTDVAAMTISTQNGIENLSVPAIEGIGGSIGIIPLPNVLLGQWYAANAATAHPKEAADFLMYLNSAKGEQLLLDVGHLVPNRVSMKDAYCADSALRATYYDSLMNDAIAYGNVPNVNFLTWANSYRSAIEAVYTGTKDPQTAMDDFCTEYKTVCGLE